MKIAIFGGSGLLGSNLIKNYKNNGIEIKSFSRTIPNNIINEDHHLIDFDNLNIELNNIFTIWKPDIIINTIALVNLQNCEENYEEALNTNATIAKTLSLTAKLHKSYFIHISTDHFFNDSKKTHYETDEVSLLNNYAKTKYIAEKEVISTYPASLIVRTNIIGFRYNQVDSFFEWLIKALKNNEKINLYNNYFTSPISVAELSNILLLCYTKKLTGIFNISSCEVINKFQFGIMTAQKFGYSTQNIEKATLSNSNTTIQRALSLGLNVSKIENNLNIKMPTISETLHTLYKEFHEQ